MRTRRPFPDVEETDTFQDLERALGHVTASSTGTVELQRFTPHTAENRKARRAGVATWQPPKTKKARNSSESRATLGQQDEGDGLPVPPPHRIPTRRELLAQRKRARLGTVDPALRRLQREAIRKVKR